MIEKVFNVPAVDDRRYQRVFPLSGMEKTAASTGVSSHNHFSAALKDEIRSLRSNPAYSYMVIIPIGAYEYWGPNSRGDAVLEHHLAPLDWKTNKMYAKRPFGYRTFLNGKFFAHHKNKPAKGHPVYGDIVFTNYNRDMHWVELLVKVFREPLGKDEPRILEWIDSGQPFDVSMGLYALAEVCPVCGNTRRHHEDPLCIHLTKTFRGTIMPNGHIACMINLFPKFHDLSGVDEGADSIAHGIEKVASRHKAAVSAGSPAVLIPSAPIERELKKLKRRGFIAQVGKVHPPRQGTEMLEKRSLVGDLVGAFSKEAALDPAELLQAGHSHGPDLMKALVGNRILLTPSEFSAVYLGSLGDVGQKKALIMIRKRVSIPYPQGSIESVSIPDLHIPSLADRWVQKNLLMERSCLSKVLRARIRLMKEEVLDLGRAVAALEKSASSDWSVRRDPSLEQAYSRYLGMVMGTPERNVRLSGGVTAYMENPGDLGVEKVAGLGTMIAMPTLTIPLWIMAKNSKGGGGMSKEDSAFLQAMLSQGAGKTVTVINPPPMPDLRPTAVPYELLASLMRDKELDDESR